MKKHLTAAPLLALIASVLLVLSPSAAHAADKDCGDFANQAQAQDFYEANGAPQEDPHRLDADNDGKACDSLPCPCSSGSGSDSGGTTAEKTLRQAGRVLAVIDGDTVDVRLRSGKKKRVRMIGIDSPEVHGTVECGGKRVSRQLKRALPPGTRVRLVSDPTQDRVDRYGRILRYVHKKSTGRDMNRAQVWRGNATVYVYANNPFKRVASYRKAQRSARANDRGIWRTCR
jgi:endonuclease YncB( thermonuclease family)